MANQIPLLPPTVDMVRRWWVESLVGVEEFERLVGEALERERSEKPGDARI